MRSSALEASSTLARMPGASRRRRLMAERAWAMPSAASGARAPAIAHAVHRFDRVEARVRRGQLSAYALDVRGDGAFVDDHAGVAHELLAALDVTRYPGERMHDPELGDGE